jgi:hypothetical protein
MQRLSLVLFGLLVLVGICDASPLGTGIKVLSVYAGTWKVEIMHLHTPFSKAGKESYTLRNDCWGSGDFYACNQYVDGESKAELVFSYNAKDKTYVSYPVIIGSETARAGKLMIKDNVWTFPWETTDKGKTTHFRVVNTFTSPQGDRFPAGLFRRWRALAAHGERPRAKVAVSAQF